MILKSISSTAAQNNFGQVMDEVTQNQTRYVVERRGVPQVIVLSLEDFWRLLDDQNQRQRLQAILREVRPQYRLGQPIDAGPD